MTQLADTSMPSRQKVTPPIIVRLLQISSPDHLALWNALSCENLAGHLDGELGDAVRVRIDRVRTAEEIPAIIADVAAAPPDLLGMSAEVGSLALTERLLDALGAPAGAGRGPLLVLGNQLPTYVPEHFLDRAPGAVVVSGEGEESLLGLIEHLLSGRPLEAVPNLVFRTPEGVTVRTAVRTPDLSRLVHPPRLDTVSEVVRDGGNALVESSRGCSWSRCAYCTVRAFRNGRGWEGLPVERVMRTVELLVRQGVTELNFGDDELFGGRAPERLSRIDALANGLEEVQRRSGRRIDFRIFVIPHTIYRRNQPAQNEAVKRLIRRLQQVGLTKIYIGVESGCPSQMRRYRRGYALPDLEQTIRIIRDELAVELDVGFIMFDPELTIDELLVNVRFFRRWGLIKSNQWPFRHLAVNVGSWLHRRLEAEGLIGGVDLNYLSCDYTCRDPHVARISAIINDLSIPPGPVFFALKAFSKRQFNPAHKTAATLAAQAHVEANGIIYLDLMEELARMFKKDRGGDPGPAVARARSRIEALIEQIRLDVRSGRLDDEAGFLEHQIGRYLRAEVKQFVK